VTGAVPGNVAIASLALIAYVAGLTYAARQENLDRVGNLWPLLMLAAPIVLALPALAQAFSARSIWLVLAGWTVFAVYLLAKWLVAEVARQRAGPDERRVALALGLSGRKVGRTDLLVNSEQAVFGRHLRADWQPETLGTDEAARVAILLATYRGDDQAFAARV